MLLTLKLTPNRSQRLVRPNAECLAINPNTVTCGMVIRRPARFALPLSTTSVQLPCAYVCGLLVTKRLVVVRLSMIVNNRKKSMYLLVLLIMLNNNPVVKKATVTEHCSNDCQQMCSQNRAITNASANYLEDSCRDLVTLSH